jgi:hypothetical protein
MTILLKSLRKNTNIKYIMVLVIMQLALWIPTNFNLGPVLEEWDLLGVFVIDNKLYFNFLFSERFQDNLLRPLNFAFHSLSYYLNPNGFYGWHLVHLVIMFAKSSAFFLLFQIFLTSKEAFIWALVATIHPADTQQMTFRSVSNNSPVALSIIASMMFFFSCMGKFKHYTLVLNITASIMAVASALVYPASITILISTIAAIIWLNIQEGYRYFRSTLFLALAISIVGFYWAIMMSVGKFNMYEQNLYGSNYLLIVARTIKNICTTFIPRLFVGGWIDAITITLLELNKITLIISILATIGVIRTLSYVFQRVDSEIMSGAGLPKAKLDRTMLLYGVLTMLLGSAVFAASGSHAETTQRTYMFAAVGASILTIRFLDLGWVRPLREIVLGVMIVVGCIQQMYQYHHYSVISQFQAKILQTIIAQLQKDATQNITIVDYTSTLGTTWNLGTNMQYALSYLLEKRFSEVRYCLPDAGVAPSNNPHKWITCRINESRNGQGTLVYFEDLLDANFNNTANTSWMDACVDWADIFGNSMDIRCEAHREYEHLTPRISALHRIARATSDYSRLIFGDLGNIGSTPDNFGKYWGLDRPTASPGVGPVEWIPSGTTRISAAWVRRGDVSLSLGQIGGHAVYQVSIPVVQRAPKVQLESVKVSFKNEELPCVLTNYQMINCVLENSGESILARLKIESPIQRDYYNLSIMIGNITIKKL